MKVISELIYYFQRRSGLSQIELDQLAQDGWIQSDHINSDGSRMCGEDWDYWREVYDYPDTDAGDDFAAGQKRKSKKAPAKDAATATELEGWLAARYPGWLKEHAVLDQVAPRQALLAMTQESVAAKIQEVVKLKRVLWGDLWHSLAQDDFRLWFSTPAAHGAATRAFRAVLESGDAADSTKYRWILRYPQVAAISEIARAQRVLLRAGYFLLGHDPGWIAAQVRRSPDRLSRLVLTLADCARRFEQVNRHQPSPEQDLPAILPGLPAGWTSSLPLPPHDECLRAVAAATQMCPSRVVPLLSYCAPKWLPKHLNENWIYASTELAIPAGWLPQLGTGFPYPPPA